MSAVTFGAFVAFLIAAAAIGALISAVVFYALGRRDDTGFELGLRTYGRIVRRAVATAAAGVDGGNPAEAAALASVIGRIRTELSKIGVQS